MSLPGDTSWIPKEVGQVILYSIVGMIVGCLFVVGSYLLSHSLTFTIVAFAVVAIPLYFGSHLYLWYTVGRLKKNKEELRIRVALYFTLVHGFCLYTLPAVFLVYAFLQL
jgi:hypothetical protein